MTLNVYLANKKVEKANEKASAKYWAMLSAERSRKDSREPMLAQIELILPILGNRKYLELQIDQCEMGQQK